MMVWCLLSHPANSTQKCEAQGKRVAFIDTREASDRYRLSNEASRETVCDIQQGMSYTHAMRSTR